jgi:hypothetical protein
MIEGLKLFAYVVWLFPVQKNDPVLSQIVLRTDVDMDETTMLVMRDEQGRRFLICCPGPHLPPVLLFSEPPYERWFRPGGSATSKESAEGGSETSKAPSAEKLEALPLDHPCALPAC